MPQIRPILSKNFQNLYKKAKITPVFLYKFGYNRTNICKLVKSCKCQFSPFYVRISVMKKLALLGAGLLLSATAFANDSIVGTWKMKEKGTDKAIMVVTKSGDTYTGKITQGLTDKAQKTVGKTVLHGVKFVEGGTYKGKGKHPTLGISAGVTVTVNGNNITIKSKVGTQTGVRQ